MAAVARQLAEEIGNALAHPVTVGGAGPVPRVTDLAGAHDEAVRCVTALRSLGRSGQGASLAELGFVGLVLGDEPDVPGFVSSALGPLLEYDERRGTDLVGTLHAYFAAGGNLARTREALHVHVNTVAQRLDRVEQADRRGLAGPRPAARAAGGAAAAPDLARVTGCLGSSSLSHG